MRAKAAPLQALGDRTSHRPATLSRTRTRTIAWGFEHDLGKARSLASFLPANVIH